MDQSWWDKNAQIQWSTKNCGALFSFRIHPDEMSLKIKSISVLDYIRDMIIGQMLELGITNFVSYFVRENSCGYLSSVCRSRAYKFASLRY